jgi:hypothetical protein
MRERSPSSHPSGQGLSLRSMLRRISGAARAGLLCLLIAVGFATLARAESTPIFSYTLTNGGIPNDSEFNGSFFQKFSLFGDTHFLDGTGGFGNSTYLSSKLVGRPPDNSFGAIYWKTPVDTREGFQTKFTLTRVSGGISLIIKNPTTSDHLTNQGEFGFDGMKKAVAVNISIPNQAARICVPDGSGNLTWFNDFTAVNYTSTTGQFEFYGEVLVRYIPSSKLLDVYHWQPNNGYPSLVLRATNFDLSKYGVLENGRAEIGLIGRGYQPTEDHVSEVRLDAWELGNNVQFSGITSAS